MDKTKQSFFLHFLVLSVISLSFLSPPPVVQISFARARSFRLFLPMLFISF